MIPKSVFISYRRDPVGKALSGRIYDILKMNGFDVFQDIEDMIDGYWKEQIIDNIIQREIFLFILTPNSLDRCTDSEDPFRMEYETAIKNNKKIIPIKEETEKLAVYKEKCPEEMQSLFERQVFELRSGNFQIDIEALINRYFGSPLLKNEQYLDNKFVYPNFKVKKIPNDRILKDPFIYDLLTLLFINRNNNVTIYGHEKGEIYNLSLLLNGLEKDISESYSWQNLFPKRTWLSVEFNIEREREFIAKLNEILIQMQDTSLGIIIIPGNAVKQFSFLKNVFESNPTKKISIIIDYHTRNIEVLKGAQESLRDFINSNLYVSVQIGIDEIIVKRKNSFFNQKTDLENIVFYLEKVLAAHDKFEEIESMLGSLKKIKIDGEKIEIKASAFSPQGFLNEFENILNSQNDNKENWEQFFVELLPVFNTYTPEFIEYIVYFSSRIGNDFIRFTPLKFAIESGKHLIDYWVEGTGCKKESFNNIKAFITSPIVNLFYPILRYYNRHNANMELRDEVRQILETYLDGKFYKDFWLAEHCLSKTKNKYTSELLRNQVIRVSKLLESGLDIFEELDPSIFNTKLITDEMMDKILMSTCMTSKKLNIILEKHPYLILQ